MLNDSAAMPNIAVKDIEVAKKFYGETLGLQIQREDPSGRTMYKTGSTALFIYESEFAGTNKADYVAWEVGDDFTKIMAKLKSVNVVFEHYNMPGIRILNDIHVIGEMGVVWFKDPDGNIISIAGKLSS
jgi:predicted enzyme related to lactoylglutathione lyase